jgi:hypothetical protein
MKQFYSKALYIRRASDPVNRLVKDDNIEYIQNGIMTIQLGPNNLNHKILDHWAPPK